MPATPHHFCGTLTAATAQPLAGIHQITVELTDDDGIQHQAFVVFGRDELAARNCSAMHADLQVGQRYHGSATSRSTVQGKQCHFGRVVLAADRRRVRFAPAIGNFVGAAA